MQASSLLAAGAGDCVGNSELLRQLDTIAQQVERSFVQALFQAVSGRLAEDDHKGTPTTNALCSCVSRCTARGGSRAEAAVKAGAPCEC